MPSAAAETLSQPTELDAQEALVCTMVLVAAADGGITDPEIGVMSAQVQTLPAFRDFSPDRLQAATEVAVSLLREDDGLKHAAGLIRKALDPRWRETAYALACEVIAADDVAGQQSLQMLEFVAAELHLDPLVTTAIERARGRDIGGAEPYCGQSPTRSRRHRTRPASVAIQSSRWFPASRALTPKGIVSNSGARPRNSRWIGEAPRSLRRSASAASPGAARARSVRDSAPPRSRSCDHNGCGGH